VIWSGPRAETLEQALRASDISSIENDTHGQGARHGTSSRIDSSTERLAVAL